MSTQSEPGIFDLQFDEQVKSHFFEIARWAKLLAVVGLVIGGLAILLGFGVMLFGSQLGSAMAMPGVMGLAGLVYILIGALYFYPCWKQLHFAREMPVALGTGDQGRVNIALNNLRIVFRFWGIATIVMLALYALVIVGVMIIGIAG